MSEARANARMALMLAIGELQKEMGPDQRVNAAADLTISGLNDGRQRWVGTWDSWPASEEERPTPQFRRWLVSGDPALKGDPAYPSTASNLVTLIRGSPGAAASAPKVALPNGGLAFAVTDESAKACLGPTLNSDSENLADHLARYQSPPAGHGALPGLETVPRDDVYLGSIASTKTVDCLPKSETRSSQSPVSYTTWSEGLLTDVRNGGFRKDLSLYFSDPASGSVTDALYQNQNGSRRGINFNELRNFHEVSTRLSYDASSYTHPDGGKLNSDVPCMVGQADKVEAGEDPFFAYLRPVMIRCSWHISAYSIQNSGSGKYKICIVVEPVVWLWNPFDVNLVMNPGGHLGIRCWGIPYDFTIVADGKSTTVKFSKLTKTGGAYVGLEIGKSSPVAMRPGEVLIYSLGRGATAPIEFTGGVLGFDSQLGWSDTGGFWIDTGIEVDGSSQVAMSMTPTTDRQASGFAVVEFLAFVGSNTINAGTGWYGGLMIDRSSGSGAKAENPGGRLDATDFPPGMFKDVPVKNFGSASNLTEPQPLALFSYLARTEREGSRKSRYLARLNPAAMGYDHQAVDANTLQSLPYEPLMQPLSGGLDRGIDYDGGKGFFGPSYKADVGQSHLVTHAIPRERPVTLGKFQHALANGVERWIFKGNQFYDRILQPSITHAIGNSFALPCITPDKTSGTFNGTDAVDHSWLANDALWDQWFVSSVAERSAPHISADQRGNPREIFARFAGASGQTQPLPNRHYRYVGRDPEEDMNELFSGTNPKTDAYLKIAPLLRVHGAFNINSTDPAAWFAMFRSTHGLNIPVEPCQDTNSDWENAGNPIAGLLVPKGSAAKTGDLSDPSSAEQWTGYRDATDDELKELANAMVEEVKKRGPFLSLADFVNRRLVTDPDLASKGALQAALDNSLNKPLETGSRSNGDSTGVEFPGADRGSQMTDVPGHVKQGDILTTLGTRFTPRSDTFTVRAYGESRSPTGQLLASARCEAVIQREAGYVDPANTSAILPANLTITNKRFGRKFKMLAFRWIPQSES